MGLALLFSIDLKGQASAAADASSADPVLRMTDAEQMAFACDFLNAGMPAAKASAFGALASNRRSLVAPLIGQKIADVLRSREPRREFTERGVDPGTFLGLAIAALTSRGDEHSLAEVSKLMTLDPKRFERLPVVALSAASGTTNPFSLAYYGLGLGNPALDKAIAAWAADLLREPDPDDSSLRPRRQWAQALVRRYGGVPRDDQWVSDPLVSKLSAALVVSLRSDVYRLAEYFDMPRRMPHADQIAFVKEELNHGIRGPARDTIALLATANSYLILPLIADKVVEVTRSGNPGRSFARAGVDPALFTHNAVAIIAQTADREAMIQAGRLLELRGFGGLPAAILRKAAQSGNPFHLVYAALELNDPELGRRILTLIEEWLREPQLNIPRDRRRQWAEALVDRYHGVPSSSQWSLDLIAARLSPDISIGLQRELSTLAHAEWERRLRQ